MKFTLISLGLSTDAIGIRILCALLKQHGHVVQLIFLPSIADIKRRVTGTGLQYSQRVLDQVVELCRQSDLVGLSVMTHHSTAAKSLTQRLKSALPVPVMWGGVHPTVVPEECLQWADIVCVGEGETAVLELADRFSEGSLPAGIEGIWIRDATGRIMPNGVGKLAGNLDALPFPDYSFTDHHLLINEDIRPMTAQAWHDHLMRFFPPVTRKNVGLPAYQVLSARGCPYLCTFCGEVPVAEMYKGRYFRKRSVENLIAELEWVKRTFSFIGEICICDDTFPSRALTEIEEFTKQYTAKIALPFYCLTSPANVRKDKFDLLVDAGLTTVGMGIQSGSPRVLHMYDRDKPGDLGKIVEAAKIFNSYPGLLPYYDFIVENPFEGKEDILATLRLMARLPRPMRTRVYALSFFPGTRLYAQGVSAGLVGADVYEKTFGQRTQGGYLNFLIDLTKHGVPQWLLNLLVSRPCVFAFDRKWIDPIFLWLQNTVKRLLLKLHFTDSGLS